MWIVAGFNSVALLVGTNKLSLEGSILISIGYAMITLTMLGSLKQAVFKIDALNDSRKYLRDMPILESIKIFHFAENLPILSSPPHIQLAGIAASSADKLQRPRI